MDEHKMVFCETEGISGRFLYKNSHILQNVPQNLLKCNFIVITAAMPLLNSTEVFVWVVYFPPKPHFISMGRLRFFALWHLSQFVQLRALFFRCVAILCNRKSYKDWGNNFVRLGPWPRDYMEIKHIRLIQQKCCNDDTWALYHLIVTARYCWIILIIEWILQCD